MSEWDTSSGPRRERPDGPDDRTQADRRRRGRPQPPAAGAPYGQDAGSGQSRTYGPGAGYGQNRAYGAGAGYGQNQAYGGDAGYGQNPAYGGDAGYGQNPAYGGDAGYGQNPAYGGDAGYGQNPAYGPDSGYGGSPAPRQDGALEWGQSAPSEPWETSRGEEPDPGRVGFDVPDYGARTAGRPGYGARDYDSRRTSQGMPAAPGRRGRTDGWDQGGDDFFQGPRRRGPDSNPQRRSPDSGSLRRSPDSGSLRRSPDSGSLRRSPDSGSLRRSADSGSLRRSLDSGPLRRGPDSRPLRRVPAIDGFGGRRRIIAVSAVGVVVVVVAAIFLTHKSSPSTTTGASTRPTVTSSPPQRAGSQATQPAAAPVFTLSTPATAGGYPKGSDPQFLAAATTLAQGVVSAIKQGGDGTVHGAPVSASYQLGDAQTMEFVGYQGTFEPTKIAAGLKLVGSDPNTYPAGPHGGVLGCANTTATPSGAVCIWSTTSTLGVVEFFDAQGPETLVTGQPKGASDTVKLRSGVETLKSVRS